MYVVLAESGAETVEAIRDGLECVELRRDGAGLYTNILLTRSDGRNAH
jgi:hypothetical protein